MKGARDWWGARGPRERRAIGAGLLVLVLALALVLWLDAERTRARLAAELPRLRASIAALERDAAEVQRLRAMAAVQAAPQGPLVTLATAGGGLAGAQVSVLDERRVKVSGEVAFGALLEWLRNAQATHGMRVENARLEALPAQGRVRAELLLARS
jgi:type II secretory pathway component PulM